MRVFLGAHHAHFAHGLVKQYGGLLHFAAVFERFNLPADFRFDGFQILGGQCSRQIKIVIKSVINSRTNIILSRWE